MVCKGIILLTVALVCIDAGTVSNLSGETCNCNGRSETCPDGVCSDCRQNTSGANCEICIDGSFGLTKNGEPHRTDGCSRLCNEFCSGHSKRCTVDVITITCVCQDGFRLPDCSECQKGYYEDGPVCKYNATLVNEINARNGVA